MEFHIREITQGSKKKTYGPYEGYIEKLKEPIELKGRIIKYKQVAKLRDKKSVKKGGMLRSGPAESKCIHDRNNEGGIETTALRLKPSPDLVFMKYNSTGNNVLLDKNEEVVIIDRNFDGTETYFLVKKKNNGFSGWVRAKYIICPAEVKDVLPKPSSAPLRQENNSWLASFQPQYPRISKLEGQPANFSRYQGPSANFSGFSPPSARLSGLRGQPANLSAFPAQSAYNQGQSANFSEFPLHSASLSAFPQQSAFNQRPSERFSGLRGQPANLSAFPTQSASLSTNIQVPEKLYNCVNNLQLFQSITSHIIPNVFIPKGEVVEVLETVSHFGDNYNKIGVSTPQGYIEGFVESKNLKKTRWLCNHETCLRFNGPYDKTQNTNRSIPKSVAVILRNPSGDILVGTETDPKKMSEFNKSIKGYHLLAGKIDPDSCPVYSSYDEIAEEGRFLPVENKGKRNFKLWDSIFKPDGKYKMQPWLSSGRAIVFVGEIKVKDSIWDALNPPYGNLQHFTNPEQLTDIFSKLSKQSIDRKYREKINFKWVSPLPSGSLKQNWDNWSRMNQMFDWGKNIIEDYVEHSAQSALAQPLQDNFSRPTFSPGVSVPLPAPSYNQDLHFDSQIILLINEQTKKSDTRLNDLLELCKTTYYKMFQNQIPPQKLSKLKQYILSQFLIKQNNHTNNPLFHQHG